MKTLRVLLAAALCGIFVLATTPVQAHHSVASEFDLQKIMSMEGTLTKVDWVMPHSWVFFDVKNSDGSTTNWAIEFPTAFRKQGGSKGYFVVGQNYKILAAPARSGDKKAYITEFTTPDGKKISMLGQL